MMTILSIIYLPRPFPVEKNPEDDRLYPERLEAHSSDAMPRLHSAALRGLPSLLAVSDTDQAAEIFANEFSSFGHL